MSTIDQPVAEQNRRRSGFNLAPMSIIGLCCLGVVVLSIVGSWLGWAAPGARPYQPILVTSLFAPVNLSRFLSQMPATYFGFPPLGMVVLVMIGAGLAEKVGLIGAALEALLVNVPARALTPFVAMVGILGHIGSDAAYFILIPFAGYAFAAAGRHPFAGICAAFAAVGGGFGANLIITPSDIAVYSLTESAAQILAPGKTINILANYFLLAAFAVLVIAIVTVLTDVFLEPKLPVYSRKEAAKPPEQPASRHALPMALCGCLAILVGGCLLGLPKGAPLRAADGGLTPFYHSFVTLTFLSLTTGALLYGSMSRRIRSDSDVYDLMRGALSDCAPFLLLILFASHFSAFLQWSNLAAFAAAYGAAALRALHLTGPALVVTFSAVTAGLNLILPSTTAKWALMAPTVVPMMMELGISPELTAAAYRIGASASELITPTAMPPIVYIFAQRYRDDLRFSVFLQTMFPYFAAILLAGLSLLCLWTTLHFPLGPTGAEMYINLHRAAQAAHH